MKGESQAQRIALFVDFENLVTRTGIAPEAFDLQPAIDTLLEKGKVVFRRAYADWARFSEAAARRQGQTHSVQGERLVRLIAETQILYRQAVVERRRRR